MKRKIQYTTIKKTISIGIIAILCCITFSPTINATIQKNTLENEYIDFTFGISTFFNRREITRQLTVKDAHKLSEQLNQTYQAVEQFQNPDATQENIIQADRILDTTIAQLKYYQLLPISMTSEQARALMTGEYGKKMYDRYMKHHPITLTKDTQPTEVQYDNIACFVKAGGTYVYGQFLVNLPFILTYSYLSNIAYSLYETGHYYLGAIFNGLSLIPYFTDILLALFPRLFIPVGLITMQALSGWYDDTVAIGSIGLNGRWALEGKEIEAVLIGFVGIYHPFGFFGFASSVSATKIW